MAEKNTTYRIFEHISDVDISEQDIMDYDPVVLDKLLIDHTMSAKARAEASDQEKVVNGVVGQGSVNFQVIGSRLIQGGEELGGIFLQRAEFLVILI